MTWVLDSFYLIDGNFSFQRMGKISMNYFCFYLVTSEKYSFCTLLFSNKNCAILIVLFMCAGIETSVIKTLAIIIK